MYRAMLKSKISETTKLFLKIKILIYLMGVHLTGVHVMGIYFIGMRLIGVHLIGVCFIGMHLMSMCLMGVHLTGVHLMGVYLINVHFTGVHLMGVHPTGMYLTYEPSLRAGPGWRESLCRHQGWFEASDCGRLGRQAAG
jgi:uncharacterized protein YjbI with pentapeptide repeats